MKYCNFYIDTELLEKQFYHEDIGNIKDIRIVNSKIDYSGKNIEVICLVELLDEDDFYYENCRIKLNS